ncbi:Re/Si-specific NAD(P)(+) transhydrogenase subunit alpha [Danxiaibacter flavus]|uniref:proton-translocating NAD(P)(+) transhydrogenase n=1 Tax=Danxiaibacter flavus TaxID=3049108 RepID=A0ABV3ZBF2_9BACT|nr:Re/Si-specific NAD(P)(+) transhydrogenase subunit alpha [Chitinophagaceae bacterium DXS]
MIVSILKEIAPENRVSILPEQIDALQKMHVEVWVEMSAGEKAHATDNGYLLKNVAIKDRTAILQSSDIILSINGLTPNDLAHIKPGTVLLGVFQPLFNAALMKHYAERNLTVFSIDMIPRTTRAQSMDVLSSQANIAGYKAVLLAADLYPRYFPMFMTAAGSIPPAKVLILGAGVAGLQAIATARRLGAVVEVFDTRPAVKEEVMSLGAKFVEVEGAADATAAGGYAVEQSKEYQQKQQKKIFEAVGKADIIITTAQIPGKKAPLLITEEMMLNIKRGSVIIDLAAATGGNTPHTHNNKTIDYNGITIVGNSNLAATMPYDASKLYGKNILNFLQLIINKEGAFVANFEDELVKGCCITYDGDVVHDKIKVLVDSAGVLE